MISVVIATHDSERTLVPTLSALVPAAMSGLISEVVVADAASTDATAEVADIAGCRFMASNAPLGERLKDAAVSTRTPWLMFLRAGLVPEPIWMTAAENFMQTAVQGGYAKRAAVFRPSGAADLMRPSLSEILALLRAMLGGGLRPDQGLLIARQFYDELGGHPNGAHAESGLLKMLGRRRLTMLSAGARQVG